jgi:DNA-binding NtrC family response regulator
LRERREDIPLLVNHFLEQAAAENNRPLLEVAPEAMEGLMAYSWPGNVRELRNLIDRLVILTRHQTIQPSDLPENIRDKGTAMSEKEPLFINRLPADGLTLKQVERELIEKTLIHFEGHRSKTARALGISRKSLYERMQRDGLT